MEKPPYFDLLFLYDHKAAFQQKILRCLNSLHTPALTGISGNAGKESHSVIRGRGQIAPIAAADFGHSLHQIGAGTHGCGIGDLIAHIEILDAADHIFGAAIMPADSHIAVPDAGTGEMPQPLFMLAVVSPSQR